MAATTAADLDERIGQSLSGASLVALRGLGVGLDRRPDDGTGVRSHLALDPDQPIHRLANLQIAPLVRPVRLDQCALRIDLVLEALGDAGELPGVHLLGGLEQHVLRLAHLGCPHVLGSPGHRDRVLIADLAAGQRFFRSRQLLELPGGLHVLGRGAR